ncbi:MAG: FMN-binding protein [Calditrichaeota bacterium]|nr:FMN-binding protein [Calditrichota bacterium]
MKDRVRMVVVLVVSAAISATLLGWVYNYTKPTVQINQEKKLKRMVLDAFSIPYDEANLLEVFAGSVEVVTGPSGAYYRAYEMKNGVKTYTGVAFELSGPGFWAPIRVILALDEDLQTVRGFKVVEQAETPGLGGRMNEPWFQEQFKGKKIVPALHVVHGTKASGPNEVDAITGATETSKALDRIISRGVASFLAGMHGVPEAQDPPQHD